MKSSNPSLKLCVQKLSGTCPRPLVVAPMTLLKFESVVLKVFTDAEVLILVNVKT